MEWIVMEWNDLYGIKWNAIKREYFFLFGIIFNTK